MAPPIRCILIAVALGLTIGLVCARADGIYVKAYFGEPVTGLNADEQASFDRGQALFVKRWDESRAAMRNAESCVSCHSVPMPGGSGMSDQALVRFSSMETVQRRSPNEMQPIRTPEIAERRRTPPLFGIGLLEYSRSNSSQNIFGAFAEMNSLKMFIARAFAIEMGISSEFYCARTFSFENYPTECEAQVSLSELEDVVTFVRFLAAPPNRYSKDKLGERLFVQAGCGGCHINNRSTLSDAPTPIRVKSFAPYTDMEVHKLGGTRALRTAPLWGLNSYGPPYLHDGSANSIEEAIGKHAGEAKTSRDNYLAFEERDKIAVLDFLKSL